MFSHGSVCMKNFCFFSADNIAGIPLKPLLTELEVFSCYLLLLSVILRVFFFWSGTYFRIYVCLVTQFGAS